MPSFTLQIEPLHLLHHYYGTRHKSAGQLVSSMLKQSPPLNQWIDDNHYNSLVYQVLILGELCERS